MTVGANSYRTAKQKKAVRKAMESLVSMPMPEFDLNKIRAAMVEHDKHCGLCNLIFGRRTK